MAKEDRNVLPAFHGNLPGSLAKGLDGKDVPTAGCTYSDWRYKLGSLIRGIRPALWVWVTRQPGGVAPVNFRLNRVLDRYNGLVTEVVRSLRDEALQLAKRLGDDADVRQILERLDEKYFAQTASTRFNAIRRLVVEKQGDRDIESYANEKARCLREDLQGRLEPQELLLASISLGARPEFEDLCTNVLVAGGAAPPDIDAFVRQLAEKEKRQTERRETDVQSSVALTAGASSSSAPPAVPTAVPKAVPTKLTKGLKKQIATCFNTWSGKNNNQNNNQVQKPWWKKNTNGKGGGKGKGGKGSVCWRCDKPGHRAWECTGDIKK
jgi:hypothetical protein